MTDFVRMFVNGRRRRAVGSLSDALADAMYLGTTETVPAYRFYSISDEFPRLFPVESNGRTVPGEVYELPYDMLRTRLLPREPPELELTVIQLADGRGSTLHAAARFREDAGLGVTDISDAGGWLAYRASLAARMDG